MAALQNNPVEFINPIGFRIHTGGHGGKPHTMDTKQALTDVRPGQTEIGYREDDLVIVRADRAVILSRAVKAMAPSGFK